MRICSLASGSSGNSIYIESESSRILVDAGISPRSLKKRLQSLGVDINDIDAVVVTHEHADHTRSLVKLSVPVYVTVKTVPVWKDKVDDLNQFENDEQFVIKDMTITPFSVPHDAIDPVGFTIEFNGTKIGIVTDIGSVTGLVVERLRRSSVLVLESNHDIDLLLSGTYPWELKQRIKGNLGHLSNSQSARLLSSVYHDGLEHVVLAHLSKRNNSPEAAYQEAAAVLRQKGNDHTQIHLAPRNSVEEVVNL